MTTLKDIAIAAGVSVDTVSRVLNGKAGEAWPSAVRRAERIRELATQLNYAPNKAAQIMRTRKTKQIGVLVSELYNPFTGRKVEAIADALAGYGYEMLLGLTRSHPTDPAKFFTTFSRNLLDGIINLDPLLGNDDLKRIAPHMPCVTFGRSEAESPAMFDIRAAVTVLMEHLWSLGHHRIGIVTGMDKGDVKRVRVSAWEAFYASRPIAARAEWVIEGNWKAEHGRQAARELIATNCTACVAGNDLLAVGLIAGLREQGREVPRDYSVVSIEDSLLTEITYPPLTSARQPVAELVRITVAALIDQLEGRKPTVTTCQVLPPELVVRQSCTAATAN
ncbi:LacI family DNA-binding transcriptional regulator [Geminisphaera colitermitum]|uniref:LacI family DNA-binding transcriptional regulator n=1 Tax=Geminisphaera colitermitum TaxID=1148786 RepID=UPI000158C894|nr:LacI family DNA-binding transcriptional regulator [Geminisphaera colitermitum]